jgi:hypothetical protein
MNKILFCGGRDFNDIELVELLFDTLEKPFVVIHGAAPGADTCVHQVATKLNLPIKAFKADWNEYGRSAGPRRNYQMLAENPNAVYAFPGGKGTAHMTQIALQKHTPTYKVRRDTKGKLHVHEYR